MCFISTTMLIGDLKIIQDSSGSSEAKDALGPLFAATVTIITRCEAIQNNISPFGEVRWGFFVSVIYSKGSL